jgi:hypothetical protein
MTKKKKTHGKGWASLPIDKMLRGAFQGAGDQGHKKKIIPRVRIFFKKWEGALDPSGPPLSTPDHNDGVLQEKYA